jgi:hypothetical protein
MTTRIRGWDICSDFHGMNDFGRAEGGGFSRPRTYNGECYRRDDEGAAWICRRKGRCVIAVLEKEEKR